MSDTGLLIMGLLVCFIFGGGVLIHLTAGQKLMDPEDEPSDDRDNQA